MHPTYIYTRVLLGLQIHVHVQCHVLLVLGMTSMNFLATAYLKGPSNTVALLTLVQNSLFHTQNSK